MSGLLSLAWGRRAKWLVLAAWLAIVVGALAAQLPAKFSDAENNESTPFLPGDSESTRALTEVERLQDGEQAPPIIVYRRNGGLTTAERCRIAGTLAEHNPVRGQQRVVDSAVAPCRL